MTKISVFLISLCLLLIHPLKSQNYSFLTIPDSLRENTSAVIRDYRLEIEYVSGNHVRQKERYVVTVTADDAKSLATYIEHYYSPFFEIKNISAKKYNLLGKETDKLRMKDFKDYSNLSSFSVFEDSRVKYFNPVIKDYPFTVEYETEKLTALDFFNERWTPYLVFGTDISVEKAELIIKMPTDKPLRYKAYNTDKEPVITETSKSTEIKWSYNNLLPFRDEDFSPYAESYMPLIKVAPSSFSETAETNSWKGLGLWQISLMKDLDNLPDETKEDIRKITAETPDIKKRIEKIYRYMQNKTRYVSIQVGIGGWKPFPAEFTDEKGYGDCKALTYYTHVLLKEAGIRSHYALVRAGSRQKVFFEDFPAREFNHVILCVPLEEDTVWLECTASDAGSPYNYLGGFTDNRNVLLITEEGGEIARTPKYTATHNTRLQNISVKVREDGNADACIERTYSGVRYDYIAHILNYAPDEQKEWVYDELDIPDFKIKTLTLENLSDNSKAAATFSSDIEIINFAKKAGTRLFIQLNFTDNSEAKLKDYKDRKHDIYIERGFTDIDTTVFELPAGYTIEYHPENIQKESSFGNFSFQLTVQENKAVFVRKVSLKSGLYPKEKYTDFRAFLKEMQTADQQKMVLVKSL